jgi:hypothetical protein
MDYDPGLAKKARSRAGITSTAIGIAFDRSVTQSCDDAIRWRLLASDGPCVVPIEVRLAKSEPAVAWQIPVLALQRAVERYAGRFAVESRLADLTGAAPIYLRSQDFRASDFEPAPSFLAA